MVSPGWAESTSNPVLAQSLALNGAQVTGDVTVRRGSVWVTNATINGSLSATSSVNHLALLSSMVSGSVRLANTGNDAYAWVTGNQVGGDVSVKVRGDLRFGPGLEEGGNVVQGNVSLTAGSADVVNCNIFGNAHGSFGSVSGGNNTVRGTVTGNFPVSLSPQPDHSRVGWAVPAPAGLGVGNRCS